MNNTDKSFLIHPVYTVT